MRHVLVEERGLGCLLRVRPVQLGRGHSPGIGRVILGREEGDEGGGLFAECGARGDGWALGRRKGWGQLKAQLVPRPLLTPVVKPGSM
jgi:hypothetical protein